MTFCVVKPKERSIAFPEHEKILQTTLESYVNRVSVQPYTNFSQSDDFIVRSLSWH